MRLGTYLAESGNAATAIPMLERATKADPGNVDALNALGIAYSGVGRPDEALLMFERILSVDPRDAFALENIGTVHLQQPNTVAARDAFTRALQNNPLSSRANAGLGVVAMHEGRRDDAIGHWRRAVDLDAQLRAVQPGDRAGRRRTPGRGAPLYLPLRLDCTRGNLRPRHRAFAVVAAVMAPRRSPALVLVSVVTFALAAVFVSCSRQAAQRQDRSC